jgi:hypothetical protein
MNRGTHLRHVAGSLLAATGLAVASLLVLPATAHAAAVDIDLYAKAGSTTLPDGVTLPVWGYTRGSGDPVTAPGGPVLEVAEGDQVTIHLHNQLGEATALLVQGQPIPPDRTGAAAGGDATYTFTAGRPGTFLYEAGLRAGAQHQTAMGLHGALVVRPAAAGQAYDDAGTAYDDEAVLVLGEIDPALNNAADPAAFDMRDFRPRYFLVNGAAYPDTTSIASAGGNTLLLRYVNAGVNYHSMGVLGARQSVIGTDGNLLDFPRSYVAQTFGPGESADALVEVPGATSTDASVVVYEAANMLRNSNQGAADAQPVLGGMMTTIDVAGVATPGDANGPVTSSVAYDGSALTAAVSDAGRGGSTVDAAEYYVDSLATAAGTFTVTPGVTVDVSTAYAVEPGEHVLYVRGRDSAGNWGPFSSVLVTGADVGAPTTSGVVLTPRVIDHGSGRPVRISATADDSASGNNNIAAAEYFLDSTGPDGSGIAMTVATAAPVASVDGAIPAAVVDGLPEGTHQVWVHSRDANGNWEGWSTATPAALVVDTTGPATDPNGLVLDPNPSNGVVPYADGNNAVRLTATTLSDPISNDVNSAIAGAEAFIDTVGAPGSGIHLMALDGVFNDSSESGYVNIPLSTVKALADGDHTVYVRARDAAGNWGDVASTTLTVDKVRPTATGASVAPSPTRGAASATVTVTGNDTGTGVTGGEYFVGADPGQGNGTPMTGVTGTGPWTVSQAIDTSAWSDGTYTLRVRVRDAAGNWSGLTTTTLRVTAPLFLSLLGNANPRGVAGPADNADIYPWNGSGYARLLDVTAAPFHLPAGANVDGYDRVDDNHFYLSFATTTKVPGLGRVQNVDVVYWNGRSWQLFFDGSAHGWRAGHGRDLDAINVWAGKLYFSTRGNASPARGKGDDADIYRFDGGRRYHRVWDASAHRLPAGADVDGYVRVDQDHFYLSFAAGSTVVPRLGRVQDEDVVAYHAGTWSVYFDGTAHGLGGSASNDVDAFDLP